MVSEQFESLGHHDGAVYGGEAGDQVRHLEDGFVERGQLPVAARFVVVPADGVPGRRTGVRAGQGVHHVDYERSEASTRLRVAELVLDDLIELHAAAAKGRAVFPAQDVFNGVPHAPLELTKEGQGGRCPGGGER